MNNIKEIVRRINLNLSNEDKILAFLTTNSSISQETIIANLGLMYAESGEKVLILDTKFGSTVLTEAFKISSKLGLSDYLNNNKITSNKIINRTSNSNLLIVPNGSLKSEESLFLLGDPKLSRLINSFSKEYDRVLINVNSFTNHQDERIGFLKHASGIILINDLKMTKKKDVLALIKQLVIRKYKILGYISVDR